MKQLLYIRVIKYVYITFLLYSSLFLFIHDTYNAFWRISVISVNKMMTAIRINDSVIYDLSYVINFDTYHLFYTNMAIKNIRIHLYSYIIYDLSYVMDFDTCHFIYISFQLKMYEYIYTAT